VHGRVVSFVLRAKKKWGFTNEGKYCFAVSAEQK